jgi:hypothetical protein
VFGGGRGGDEGRDGDDPAVLCSRDMSGRNARMACTVVQRLNASRFFISVSSPSTNGAPPAYPPTSWSSADTGPTIWLARNDLNLHRWLRSCRFRAIASVQQTNDLARFRASAADFSVVISA